MTAQFFTLASYPRARYLILLLLACFALPGASVAEVTENLAYTYYVVAVRPGQPLYRQISAVSPIREDGEVFHGNTHWSINWQFRWHRGEDRVCRITSATTDLKTVITLPRLNGASAQQQASFDEFILALNDHELGHYRIAQEAAQSIDAELHALPGLSDCRTLEALANSTASRTLKRFGDMSRQYDRDTGHGRMQGAWLKI